jgi:putative transposase
LQKAKKVRAVRKSRCKEVHWMRDVNHKLSRELVHHAQAQSVGVIRLEQLVGMRQRTARTCSGAARSKARKNKRLMATWTFHQLSTFIAYKAERAGIAVEWVDPAHTSQTYPACFRLNGADDRHYLLHALWLAGHRDAVGAINISRRTGRRGDSDGATVA